MEKINGAQLWLICIAFSLSGLDRNSWTLIHIKNIQGWKLQTLRTCPSDKCQKIYLSDTFFTCPLKKRFIHSYCAGATEIQMDGDLSFGKLCLQFYLSLRTCPSDKCQKIYLSDTFFTCPLKKRFIHSYCAGATEIQMDGDLSFGKLWLQFYLSDTIFTCPGQADNL